jgi:hypothetical protein
LLKILLFYKQSEFLISLNIAGSELYYVLKKFCIKKLFSFEIPIKAISVPSFGSPLYLEGTKMSSELSLRNKDLESESSTFCYPFLPKNTPTSLHFFNSPFIF